MHRLTRISLATLTLVAIPVASAQAASKKPTRVQNGRILFQRVVGQSHQLFSIRPDGTGVRQLTRGAMRSWHGSWSPDGSKIVFARTPTAPGVDLGTIFTMRAGGGGERSLTGGLAAVGRFGEAPSFSPDGRLIAFDSYRLSPFDDGVWVMRADGSHRRRVTRNPGQTGPMSCACDFQPRFSPDGRRIVFQRDLTYDRAAIYVVNVDGSGLRRLTPWALDAGSPDWSPDGTRIAYSSYWELHAGHPSELYTIRPDGHGARQLTHHRNANDHSAFPTWSPDGKRIAFTRLQLSGTASIDLFVMRAQGGRARRLTHGPASVSLDWGTAR
jgi:TolB protein